MEFKILKKSIIFLIGLFCFLNLSNFINIDKNTKLLISILLVFLIAFSIKFKKTVYLKKILSFLILSLIVLIFIYRTEINIFYKINKGKLHKHELIKNNRKIILFELYHVSTKQYFNSLNKELDSLSKLNYTLIYEKIIDTLSEINYNNKWKHFINGPSTEEDYDKMVKDNPYLIVQNTDSLTSKFSTPVNIDLSKTYIIKEYEKINGILTENSKINKKTFNNLMYFRREENLVSKVNKLNNNKIAIIYGASHTNNIIKLLIKEKWSLIKNY